MLLVVLVANTASAAFGGPPARFPRVIVGQILAGPSSSPTSQPSASAVGLRYPAVWSDSLEGYSFDVPGRPIGWDQISLSELGVATIGTASADWSDVIIGRAISHPDVGFAFVPVEIAYGYEWRHAEITRAVAQGMGGGLAWQIILFIVNKTFGAGGRRLKEGLGDT